MPHLVGIVTLVELVLPYQSGKPVYGTRFNEARTVAQRLGDAGYRSYMAGKWHLSEAMPNQWGVE